MKTRVLRNQKQHYSIRKYSFGAASVLIGASFLMGQQVAADEQVAMQSDSSVATVTENGVADRGDTDEPLSTVSETQVTEGDIYSDRSAQETESLATSLGEIDTTSLPEQGQYTYPERTEVKNEPSQSAPTQFYVNAGDKVNYDKVVTNDGYHWISYVSYNGVRRYAGVEKVQVSETPQAVQTPVEENPKVALPDQGSYTFTSETAVKNEAKVSAPTQFVYKQGDRVTYDKVLESDGHQWLSYVSYNGVRRYADIATLTASRPVDKMTAISKINNSEAKRTGNIAIENENAQGFDVVISHVSDSRGLAQVKVPVWTEKAGQDDIIWYDATKQNDGTYKVAVKLSDHKNERGDYHIHLYYADGDNSLHGVATKKVVIEGVDPIVTNQLPETGSYTFTESTPVKNEARDAAPTQFIFQKGDRITYDKSLVADGHQWLSYVSYNGTRRYVELAKVSNIPNAKEENSTITAPSVTKESRTGSINVQNQTAQGFDVEISNVSDSQGLVQVKVPVWTENNGQDEIIWYDGVRQSDGNYKVNVKFSDHKNESGDYNIHLYYVENDNSIHGVAATKVSIKNDSASPSKVTLPAQGSYTFTTDTEVKNEAKTSAPTQFIYPKGNTVNYDKVLESDGRQWLSYISASGIRRYAMLNITNVVTQPSAIVTTSGYPNLSDYQNLSINVSIANQRMSILSDNQTIFTTTVSTGTADSPTPTGHFVIEAERGNFFYNPSVNEGAYYWVSFKDHGVYLFHSNPTDRYGNEIPEEASKLGTPSSHGCVRMSRADAKWFYENIPNNTPITIQ